jgi:membrane protease YdiL (CAAX protease family)
MKQIAIRKIVLLVVCSLVIALIPMYALSGILKDKAQIGAIGNIILHGCFLYGLNVLFKRHKIRWNAIGLIKIKRINYKEISICMWYGLILAIIFEALEYSNKTFLSYHVPVGFLGHLVAVIFAPIYEEIIFRGFLFNYLCARNTILTSLFLTSFIFALTHLGIGWPNLILAFVLGVCFNVIYIKYGNVYSCISTHMTHNLLVSAASIFK